MKNEKKIRLLTDDMPDPLGVTGESIEPLGEDQTLIDALLRMTADEMTAQVDFEGIRARALENAKAKKQKAARLRRAASYALFAAASLMVCFALVSVIGSMQRRNGNQYALNSAAPNGGETEVRALPTAAEGELVRRAEIGTVSESEEDISKTVSDLLPDSLPDGMTTIVDTNAFKICATGTDPDGEELSCVCTIETSAPIVLALGEVGAVSEGDENIYYWQIADGQYLSFKFTGFETDDTDSMFTALSKSITDTSHSAEVTPAA